nr:PEP-CTERM sorting domain-containing protein [uncultured Desulfobulbus sp.]
MKKLYRFIDNNASTWLAFLTARKFLAAAVGVSCLVWGGIALVDRAANDGVVSRSAISRGSADRTTTPTGQPQPNERELVRVKQEISQIEDASSEKDGKWLGLCQKQSIKSIEDFRRTVENDPTLSVYYAGFNWEEAKLGSLKEDVMAYVSHRKGEVIAQTAKPIKLPKGDGFITDGVRTARTYCCNDIELTPSAGSPTPGSSVFPPVDPLGALPQLLAPQHLPLTIPSYPLLSNSPGNIVYDRTPDSPPKDSTSPPVPEPGTLLLMGVGLLALAAVGRNK